MLKNISFLLAFILFPNTVFAQTQDVKKLGESEIARSDCATPTLKKFDAECWSLRVLENRDDPKATRLTLPVGVIHTEADPEKRPADPVLFMPGGTGYSTLSWEERLESYLPQVAPRTLIVWDPRGFAHATPSLRCPDALSAMQLLRAKSDPFLFGPTPLRQRVEQVGLEVEACFHKLRTEGVNVAFYNEYELSRDTADLMTLLGYDTFNLYGESAGGGHVFHTVSYLRDRIRAVIYSSPWLTPTRNRPAIHVIRQAHDHILDVLGKCVTDNPRCADMMPNASAAFAEARVKLDLQPFKTTVSRPSGKSIELEFDGSKFIGKLYGFVDGGYSDIPRILSAVLKNDYGDLPAFFKTEEVTEDYQQPDDWALGAMWAYECGDMASAKPSKEAVLSMYEQEPALFFGFETGAFCAWWDASSSVPSNHNQWFFHDTPSLFVIGEMDPCCGRQYAEKFARYNPSIQIAEFSGKGHDSLEWRYTEDGPTDCPSDIISSFLSSPWKKVGTSCLKQYRRRWNLR